MCRLAIRGGRPVREAPLPPSTQLDASAEAEMAELVRSGLLALGQPGVPAGGRYKYAFEREFADTVGTACAVAVSSGTVALDLAVAALELRAGSVVVAANYGHPSTVRGAAERNRLLLVDVDRDTLCLDAEQVSAAVRSVEAAAVITTHFAGQAGGITRLVATCEAAGVPLVEDCSHAHGARAAGRGVGSFGRLGCFSLHASKNVSAGEGGMVVTDDPALYERLWRLHDLGRNFGAPPYAFSSLAGNYRMSEVHALIGRCSLRQMAITNGVRAAAATSLRQAWSGLDLPLELLPCAPETEMHAYHLLVCRYSPETAGGLSRHRFILALCAEGIPCSAGWPRTLSAVPGLRDRCETWPTPEADRAVAETVWIDSRLLLEPQGAEQISEAVAKVAKHAHTLRRHP